MSAENDAKHLQLKTPKKKWKQTIKEIERSLDRGDDINAAENDKRNTLLHIAVLNAEVNVVKCLLNKKADMTIKNCDDRTALDIAQQLKCSDGKQIVSLLKKYQINEFVPRKPSQPQKHKNKANVTKSDKVNYFQRRSGTSGIHGQLYETKLLSFILLKALHDSKIEEFDLGSNIAGVGAFDDILFRYKKYGVKQIPKIIFLQAKHKDDPTKDKVTNGDILSKDGNLSLHKYLESYMDIIQIFLSDHKNKMFKESFNSVSCDFIIYTSATENFDKQTVMQQTHNESYIPTNDNGKIFRFQVNDTVIEKITPAVKNTLVKQIAERLSKFMNKKTPVEMTDNIIKVYHVFLAQNVISIQDQNNESDNSHFKGMFRQSFLETKNEHMLLLKNTISKELKVLKGKTETEIEERLKLLSIEVPASFGNIRFQIKKDDNEKQETLTYLCTLFDKLFRRAPKTDATVEISESDIGPDQILQPNDMELDKLGGLVGNVLILDQDTAMLKFNLEVDSLTDDSLRLLSLLKSNYPDLSRYRLDVNIPWFPKLVLSKEEDDKKVVRDFLEHVKFYANQPKEDEIEKILKKEIDVICNLNHNDSIFRAKSDVVYLKFHDEVQAWWKRTGSIKYLTKMCNFFDAAKRETLDSPLLSLLNYTYKNKIKSSGAKFKSCAIEALKITDFLKDDYIKVMVLISNAIILSSIKCIQYFDENYNDIRPIYLDLECVMTENWLEIVEQELHDTKYRVLVLVYHAKSVNKLQETFDAVQASFCDKIILITNEYVSTHLKYEITDDHIHRIDDNTNSFTDLQDGVQKMILLERELIFQGQKQPVNAVLNSEILHAIKPKTISRFINRESIKIGKSLTENEYKKTVKYYLTQSFYRCVTLYQHIINDKNTDSYYIDDGNLEELKPQNVCNDIIVITEDLTYFEKVCEENNSLNVHWFKRKNSGNKYLKLMKSKGDLNINNKDKGLKVTYQVIPKTVTDIQENVVIISSEPGMGKSTLLSHLAVHTKQSNPTLWVSKINFQDHYGQFEIWKNLKTNIDLAEAINFLYGTIGVTVTNNSKATRNVLKFNRNQIVINEVKQVTLNNIDETTDLIEIHVFNYCYNNNRVVLLFDGFDEICPDLADKVIQLLKTLNSSRVAFMWVTTRPYDVVDKLQCALGTLSFKIKPWNQLEQRQCLQNIWSENVNIEELKFNNNWSYNDHVDCFYTEVFNNLVDKSFTSLPLHIYLIAEYLKKPFKELITVSSELEINTYMKKHKFSFMLGTLYETFIEKIFFSIHYGVKTPNTSFTDLKLKRLLKKEHKEFLDSHKKISAYYMLCDNSIASELFSDKDKQDIHQLMENVKSGDEKSGIIECIIGSRPKFVHSTFCEYFASEFIYDKLKSGYCTSSFWKYLITDIFVENDKQGIRQFMDSKLGNGDQFDETFYIYNSDTVLEILILPTCFQTVFDVIVKECLIRLGMFIMQCTEKAVNADKLECVLSLKNFEYFIIAAAKKNLLGEYLSKILRSINDTIEKK